MNLGSVDLIDLEPPFNSNQEYNAIYKDETGRPYRKTYLPSGRPATNLWNDIDNPSGRARERIGYATPKPIALLERILKASSNEGDTVFDPFCGRATTLEAAHRLNRKWVGIDIAIHAVKRVAKVRWQDRLRLVEGKDFVVDGVPRTLEGARDLWKRDPYHFQKWAVEAVEGFVTTKQTAALMAACTSLGRTWMICKAWRSRSRAARMSALPRCVPYAACWRMTRR